MDSMPPLQIDYLELGKYIAKNTPAPQNTAEMTVYGVMVGVLLVALAGMAYYHVWWLKKKEAQEDKIADGLAHVTNTITELNVHLAQRRESNNKVLDAINDIKTSIAIIQSNINHK